MEYLILTHRRACRAKRPAVSALVLLAVVLGVAHIAGAYRLSTLNNGYVTK